MKVQPINSIQNFRRPTINQPNFKASLKGVGDTFVRQQLGVSQQNFIKDIFKIAKLENVRHIDIAKIVSQVTPINFNVFRNVALTMLGLNRLANVFEPSTIDNYTTNAILKYTNDGNKDFAESYTALGGRSFGVIKDATPILNEEFPKFNFEGYSISAIEDIIQHTNQYSVETFKKLINDIKLNQYEMSDYILKSLTYSPQEFQNVSQNIDKGFANLLTDLSKDSSHSIRKHLNTVDFQNKNSSFLEHFDYLIKSRGKLFDLLRFPIESEAHLDKSLRNMASMMHSSLTNTTKELDAYEARKQLELFFSTQFENVLGMILFTDKETVLQILDKGCENATEFIQQQKKLSFDDAKVLSDIIKYGKKLNKNGDLADISAKDKIFAYNVVNINRNVFAQSNSELNLRESLIDVEGGYFVDFSKIENDMRYKVLNNFGFNADDILKLNPKDIDWNSRWVYLLLLKSKNPTFQTLVREASKGNFENYINSLDNEYGVENNKTKDYFKELYLDYDAWLNGLPPETFKIAGENLTISLWNRRPQDSIFDGTFTSSCTALNGTQSDAMAEYLMSTMFNVFEIKDSKNNVVASSRVFWVNEHDPTLIVDNIEINNTFKKRLASLVNLEELMERTFEYERKFAKYVANRDVRVLFSREHVKLFDSDFIKYPKRLHYVFETIGNCVSDTAYCNAIADSITGLKGTVVPLFDVTNPD